MKFKELLELSGNGLQYVLTATQTEEVFRIIQLVVAIATSIILLSFKIADKIKSAKADGKITAEEVKDITNTIKDGIDDIKDTTIQK